MKTLLASLALATTTMVAAAPAQAATTDLVFNAPSLHSGTLNEVGSVYRYTEVTAGIDLLVAITGSSTAAVIDNVGGNESFYDSSTDNLILNISRSDPAEQDTFVNLTFTFVETGTDTATNVSDVILTIGDIDSQDGLDFADYFQVDPTQFSTLTSGSDLDIQDMGNGENRYIYSFPGLANVPNTSPDQANIIFLHAETLYGYAEVGVTDDITLIGYLPYVVATNAHDSGIGFHTFGLGDALVGAQLRVLDWRGFALSARFDVKAPLYEGAPSIQGRQSAKVPGFPRSATLFPALGDGQVDLAGYVSAGSSLPFGDGFVTVDVGYRLRSGPLTDAVVVNASGGVWVLPQRALLMANTAWIASLPSADERRVTVGKGYWSAGPALMVPLFAGLALEAGFDVVTAGVNAAGGMQALLGVSYAY